MGEYNPYQPRIVGQEWVPIRDEDFNLSPVVDDIEQGHHFTLVTARTLQDTRFYLNDFPPGTSIGQYFTASIYPAGTEDRSGPVRRVLIPCNNTGLSGGAYSSTGPGDLADPSDSLSTLLNVSSTNKLDIFFGVNNYAQLLNGKRILGVNFLYTAYVNDVLSDFDLAHSLTVQNDIGNSVNHGPLELNANSTSVRSIASTRLGAVNHFALGIPTATSERLPWRYTDLQRLEMTSSSRLRVRITTFPNGIATIGDNIFIGYAALEILYCDEQRVALGGRIFGTVPGGANYVNGANLLTMRDITGYAVNPVLQPGEYDVVLSSGEMTTGSFGGAVNTSQYPPLNAVRELYTITPHPGVQVSIPFPMDASAEGKTFGVETTHILPQLSVHTSGGPLTEVHVYGRQAVAPVYSTIYAEAEINDDVVPLPGQTYPWVRYYARRWGDTTQRLILTNQAATGQSVYITPAQWDALPEIVDRWKEVTLRFDTPPTIATSGSDPKWRWTSPSENVGNRWEVLGVQAPALSGIPGNLLNQVSSPHQLGVATYGGSTVDLVWQTLTPPVSGQAEDTNADGVILFAQEFPAPTGFSVSMLNQPLSGIGRACELDPCCIPTAITYLRPQWSPILGASGDEFETPALSGWGTDDLGQAWTVNLLGGSLPQNYAKTGGVGTVVVPSLSASQRIVVGGTVADTSQTVKVQVRVVAQGGDIRQGLLSRLGDFNNYYMGLAVFKTDSTVAARIMKRVAGVETTVLEVVVPGLEYQENDWFWIKFDVHGTVLMLKVWADDTPEPGTWNLILTDTSLTTGQNGAYVLAEGGVTNTLPLTFSFDSYYSQPFGFGTVELQRFDVLDTDWNTIMSSTSAAITGFNDFEARVGLLTAYRLRINDVYDFAGVWSPAASGTITDPGVAIGCIGGHLLIFTSNAAQDGSFNLAYSSVWEGRVEENFVFPEAAEVQLQRMYGRDFVVAFRPLERGGERFSRTVLVQAAAISPSTLGDFRNLRDMAWADLPYVCVRDEDGNRWFAAVLVPGGNVRRSRQLYMAPVDIIEVTDVPAEVNP